MTTESGDESEEGEVVDDPQQENQGRNNFSDGGSTQPSASNSIDAGASLKKRPLASSSLDALSGGGVYIPPAKRRQLEKMAREEEIKQAGGESGTGTGGGGGGGGTDDDKDRAILKQRKSWDDEKRVVHGTINRLNAETIKPLIHDLFDKVNLIRLRGVLAKSVLQAAISSPRYSNVYAALISVIVLPPPNRRVIPVQRVQAVPWRLTQ